MIDADSSQKRDSPRAWTLVTLDDPQIIAPRVLKKPIDDPELLRYLPVSASFPAKDSADCSENASNEYVVPR